MSVKLLLFKSGETVISEVKEIVSEDKVRGYLLINPHKVVTRKPILLSEEETTNQRGIELEVVLTPWIVLTNDKEMVIPIDWVVTMVDPLSSVVNVYYEKLNLNENDTTEVPQEKGVLNE
jgi:hypothetical protein